MRPPLLFCFLFLAHSISAQAAQGLVVSHGAGATATLPDSAPFTSLSSYQFVIRIHNCTDGGNYLVGGNPLNISTDCHSVRFGSAADHSMQIGVAFPAGATDVVIRAQRVAATHEMSVEVWRTDTGAYQISTTKMGPDHWEDKSLDFGNQALLIGGVWAPAISVTIDYVRFFSKPAALGSIPSPNPSGDLGDWELDGNEKDLSRFHSNLKPVNKAEYAATPEYPPVVTFVNSKNCFLSATSKPNFCVAVAGSPASLRSNAYSPNLNESLSYSWSQIDGPATGTIANNSSATASASGLSKFGQYTFRVTATDRENRHVPATLTLGVVSAGGPNDCIISDVPESLRELVGPLTPWGSSCDPWPWYDIAEVANANVLMNSFSLPPSAKRPPNPGTITINTKANPPTITGSGTHFTKDCAGMNFASHAPNCNDASAWIWWDAEGEKGNGRYYVTLSVADDTHATIKNVYTYGAPGPYSGVHYSIVNPDDVQIPFSIAQNGVGGSYSWNYYDNVIAMYRLYYRTGITAYLDYAHTLADAWWVYALDHGYNSAPNFPRLLGLPGMMARALEGNFTARWRGIENKIGDGPQGAPNPPNTEDVREAGYSESYLSLLTVLDPNITGNRARQAAYCTHVAGSINTFWANAFSQGGGIPMMDFFKINATYPSIGLQVEPLQLVITATGLRDAYRALSSSNCHDSSTAEKAINYTGTVADFIYQSGAMGSRAIPAANGGGTGRAGTAFTVGPHFMASGGTAIQSCNFIFQRSNKPCIPGKVSGKQGSTTVTGLGTAFKSSFHCNGTDGIGIISPPDNGNVAQDEAYVVASCASDTQLTLASPLVFAPSSWDIEETQFDTYSGAACAPIQGYCYTGTGSPQPSADFSIDNAGILAWMYQFTGEPKYKTWADDLFSASFGGPAGGPGTNGPPAGPMSSGQTTGPYGYISALPSCDTSAPPCGGLGLVTDPTGTHPAHWGKDFGVASGWSGAADNFLSYRLMHSSPSRESAAAKQ